MDWRAHISIDPGICRGKACVKGTRVPVTVILDNLAAGLTPDDLLQSYPTLTIDGVRAAVAYAAEIARERVLPLPENP
jgi:uncharacterized protein (DUF433 family)